VQVELANSKSNYHNNNKNHRTKVKSVMFPSRLATQVDLNLPS